MKDVVTPGCHTQWKQAARGKADIAVYSYKKPVAHISSAQKYFRTSGEELTFA